MEAFAMCAGCLALGFVLGAASLFAWEWYESEKDFHDTVRRFGKRYHR